MQNGLCQCGCGKTTALIKKSCAKRGLVAGEHYRFVLGHSRKGSARPLAERFWEKVSKGANDECWEWQASRAKFGHGNFRREYGRNKGEGAHRLAWELTYGPIPEGMDVLHKCDNPPCCNPNHLFLGTQRDNVKDMDNKRRRGRLQGDKHGMAKLSEEQVIAIRTAHAAGDGLAAIGRQYGISKSTVFGIVHRKQWTHI